MSSSSRLCVAIGCKVLQSSQLLTQLLPPLLFAAQQLGFTLLSGIYFAIFPSDRNHLNQVMAKIKADKSKQMKTFERKLEQQGGALSLV